MQVSEKDILDLSRLAFVRLDGAWFMAMAREYGIDAAWKMDVEAWKQFSYVMGKNLVKNHLPDPVWPESYIDALHMLFKVMGMDNREVIQEDGKIVIRVVECEMQKAIAKAGIADCGIATIATYEGLGRGMFGKDFSIKADHTKNLNQGAEYCEVVIHL